MTDELCPILLCCRDVAMLQEAAPYRLYGGSKGGREVDVALLEEGEPWFSRQERLTPHDLLEQP